MTQALQPGLLLQHGRYLYKIVAVEADSFSGLLVYPMQRRERIESFPLSQVEHFAQPSNKLLKAYNAAYGFPVDPIPQSPPQPEPEPLPPVSSRHEAAENLANVVRNSPMTASRRLKNLFDPRKTSCTS